MRDKNNYLKADMYRLWHSGRLFMGAVSVYAAMMFNSLIFFRSVDVLLIYNRARMLSTTVLVYIGCAAPFATVFVEDFTDKFAVPQIVRGKTLPYVLSKTVTCFFSSVLSMAAGVLAFVLTYRLKYPLCVEGSVFDFLVKRDVFGGLLKSGHHMLYFLATACLTGMFGGLLSIIAMYLSFFVKSRLYVICIPMIAHYFIDNYILDWLRLPDEFRITLAFISDASVWAQNPVRAVLYACLISGAGIMIFSLLITKRIRKEL